MWRALVFIQYGKLAAYALTLMRQPPKIGLHLNAWAEIETGEGCSSEEIINTSLNRKFVVQRDNIKWKYLFLLVAMVATKHSDFSYK